MERSTHSGAAGAGTPPGDGFSPDADAPTSRAAPVQSGETIFAPKIHELAAKVEAAFDGGLPLAEREDRTQRREIAELALLELCDLAQLALENHEEGEA